MKQSVNMILDIAPQTDKVARYHVRAVLILVKGILTQHCCEETDQIAKRILIFGSLSSSLKSTVIVRIGYGNEI